MNALKSFFKSKSRARGTFKTVVVNGCHAGGIGASITKMLAENAVHVIVLSNDHAALSAFEKNPNVTAIIYAPNSPSEFKAIYDQVKLVLDGETLSAIMNAGNAGVEPPQGSAYRDIVEEFDVHISTAHNISRAFEDLMVASHGAIINFTSAEMLEYEQSTTNHPTGSPTRDIIKRYDIYLNTTRRLFLALEDLLIMSHGAIINLTSFEMLEYERSITSNTNEGMVALTGSLRSKLAARDVKVMLIVHEPGTGLSSDGTGAWRDAEALAEDILRDMSSLPGFGRPF